MRLLILGIVLIVGCQGSRGRYVGAGVGGSVFDYGEQDVSDAVAEVNVVGGAQLGPAKKRAWLEGWGAFARNDDFGFDLDHFIGGLGLRGQWPEDRIGFWYGRFGVSYHRLKGLGESEDGPGVYVGIGRAFYLDRAKSWTLGPEFRFDVWDNRESDEYHQGLLLSLQLTYFFPDSDKGIRIATDAW